LLKSIFGTTRGIQQRTTGKANSRFSRLESRSLTHKHLAEDKDIHDGFQASPRR